MTGYTVNTGSTRKFSEGWDRVFADSASTAKQSKKPARPAAAKSAATKKSTAKAKQKKTR